MIEILFSNILDQQQTKMRGMTRKLPLISLLIEANFSRDKQTREKGALFEYGNQQDLCY
jgi:hypothetical protein